MQLQPTSADRLFDPWWQRRVLPMGPGSGIAADGAPHSSPGEPVQGESGAEAYAHARVRDWSGAAHVNTRAASGAMARSAALTSLTAPGDRVLVMHPEAGGVRWGGTFGERCEMVGYGLDRRSERIDYDALAVLAREHLPRAVVVATPAHPRLVDYARVADIASAVGALVVCDVSLTAGLLASGEATSPMDDGVGLMTCGLSAMVDGGCGGVVAVSADMAELAGRIDAHIDELMPHEETRVLASHVAAVLDQAASDEFRHVTRQALVDARTLADALSAHGVRAVTSGTDTQLVAMDTASRRIEPSEAASRLAAFGIQAGWVPGSTHRFGDAGWVTLTAGAIAATLGPDAMYDLAAVVAGALDSRTARDRHAVLAGVATLCAHAESGR